MKEVSIMIIGIILGMFLSLLLHDSDIVRGCTTKGEMTLGIGTGATIICSIKPPEE